MSFAKAFLELFTKNDKFNIEITYKIFKSILQYRLGYVSINVRLLKTLPITLPIPLSKNVKTVIVIEFYIVIRNNQ